MSLKSDETRDQRWWYNSVSVIGDSMRLWMHIGAVVFCVVLAACSGDKAKELLETAEFEERQQNVPHAKQLYEDIVQIGRAHV